jgi:hypothetical protein
MNPTQLPQRPEPLLASPAIFRKRLAPVVFALISAQFSYVLLALFQLRGGFKNPGTGPPQIPFTLGVFGFGLLSVILSFPIATRCARLPAGEQTFTTAAPAIQKRFFTGFALSQVGSIAGLLIFFVYADLNPLLFLVGLTSVAIYLHYRRVTRSLDEIEPSSR